MSAIPSDCPFAATDVVVATALFDVYDGTPSSESQRISVESAMDLLNSPQWEDAQVLHLDTVAAHYTLSLT